MRSRWLERVITWQTKLQKLLRGRYARFDQLNRGLLWLSILLIVVNIFLQSIFLRIMVLIALVLVYYRFFSKRIYVRLNENNHYQALQSKFLKKVNYFRKRWQQRKEYRYFTCPHCHQSLRAPRGRGMIKVTCSSCQEQFIKKV